jgi:hypothetical protein
MEMLIMDLSELLGLTSSLLALRPALAVYSPRPLALTTLIGITLKIPGMRTLGGSLSMHSETLKREKKLQLRI